jgi:Holliday junction resolvase RusA-like endonuclease
MENGITRWRDATQKWYTNDTDATETYRQYTEAIHRRHRLSTPTTTHVAFQGVAFYVFVSKT